MPEPAESMPTIQEVFARGASHEPAKTSTTIGRILTEVVDEEKDRLAKEQQAQST